MAAVATICFFASCTAYGQVTVSSLVGSAVPQVDAKKYEDVAKAILVFRRGRGDAALAFLAKARKEHVELPPAEVMYSQLCFGYNRPESAQSMLQLAVVRQPEDPEPWSMLADVYLRQGKLAEAEVLFERGLALAQTYNGNALRKKTQQINSHAGLAAVHERRGHWEKAELHLRRWIDLDQKDRNAWTRLAKVFFRTDRYDTAKETLDNLRSFDNEVLPSSVLMGTMYQQIGDAENAKRSMQEAINQHGEDYPTRLAVARWAMTTGDNELLETCAVKAKELEPDSIAVDALLGMSARFAGDSAKAEEIFARMVDENPASFDATNGLALSILDQDDKEKYRKALGHAQVNVKSYSDCRTTRGRVAAATFAWALHRLNENAGADRVMQTVVKSGEISPEIGYFAAEIFNAKGNLSLAKSVLEKSLASSVAFPQQAMAEKLLLEVAANEVSDEPQASDASGE